MKVKKNNRSEDRQNSKVKSEDKRSLASKDAGKVHLELETVKSMLARALADYDNLSKRVERERQDLGKLASIAVLAKLLPVLDNIERAQVHLQDSGLAIAIGEFVNILKDEGLSLINPNIGDDFDEQQMEAIEVVKGEEDNKVAEVILTGWKYNDGSVVRHAKVIVSRQ